MSRRVRASRARVEALSREFARACEGVVRNCSANRGQYLRGPSAPPIVLTGDSFCLNRQGAEAMTRAFDLLPRLRAARAHEARLRAMAETVQARRAELQAREKAERAEG